MRRRAWILLFGLALCQGPRASRAQDVTRVEDVVYGRKPGVALTMDVFKPAKPNGIGVLYMVSGGWFSSHEAINPAYYKAFLDRGETVFAIVHGSQPKYSIPEIAADIERATRFVRFHAKEYGVDPERLGIAGGSAGGHLSLMQGAHGSDGKPDAKDPVERVSSRVQAVACFFPPTDFLNYGKVGENALTGETLRNFRPAFGPLPPDASRLVFDELTRRYIETVARAESPIYAVTKQMPPTLIIHGDADTLVPIQQSELMMKKLEEVGVEHKLVVKPGQGHGWKNLLDDMPTLADWFETHLKAK